MLALNVGSGIRAEGGGHATGARMIVRQQLQLVLKLTRPMGTPIQLALILT